MTTAMTNARTIALAASILTGTQSTGFSNEASYIKEAVSSPWLSMQRLHSIGNADLFADLEQIVTECRLPDWGGDGEEPVLPETVAYATGLLRALIPGIPQPTLGVESDGQVTFEWYVSPNRLLSVSVGDDGYLYYAALIGIARHYGREPLDGAVPENIRNLIYRVVNK
jgi:hypothetical protein